MHNHRKLLMLAATLALLGAGCAAGQTKVSKLTATGAKKSNREYCLERLKPSGNYLYSPADAIADFGEGWKAREEFDSLGCSLNIEREYKKDTVWTFYIKTENEEGVNYARNHYAPRKKLWDVDMPIPELGPDAYDGRGDTFYDFSPYFFVDDYSTIRLTCEECSRDQAISILKKIRQRL